MRLSALAVLTAMFVSHAFAQEGLKLEARDLVVAPGGNDAWSGRLARPNAQGTDGPLATLPAAVAKSRELSQEGSRIILRGGDYPLAEAVVLGAADSGLTIMAYPGERPVICGSRPLGGWKVSEVNGISAWACPYEGTAFRALFVNGEARPRPRYPKMTPGSDGRDNFLRIESVPGMDLGGDLNQSGDRFVLAAGDFIAKRNLAEVEVVAMHLWIASRMPVASYDPATRLFTSTHRAPFKLAEGWGEGAVPARYYIDNVFEALTEPGEWYLDREAGMVYYIPREGETLENTRIEIGQATQLFEDGRDGGAAGERYTPARAGVWPDRLGAAQRHRGGRREAHGRSAGDGVPGGDASTGRD